MRNINAIELQNLVEEYGDRLEGARLQKAYSQDNELVLELYCGRSTYWLHLDITPSRFGFFLCQEPPKSKGKTKPILLFLRSHFIGKKIFKIEKPFENERIVDIYFSPQLDFQLRLILFPQARNIILSTPDKRISWNKEVDFDISQAPFHGEVRSVSELENQWREERQKKPSAQKKSQDPQAKLKKAIDKIKSDLENKKGQVWGEIANKLSAHGVEGLSSQEVERYFTPSESLQWNIQNAFAKEKQVRIKIENSMRRIEELERQLSSSFKEKPVVRATPALKLQKSLQHKKIHGEDNQLIYVGRNSKDNIELLKKAKPWFIWLHLRDYPSAHAIVALPRGKKVVARNLELAAQALLEKTFKEKIKQKRGEKFSIVYAECRHVRPIKGDKMGRVHYSKDSNFIYQLC